MTHFLPQLAWLLAYDGKVTLTKKGRYYVLETANNKVTIPQDMVPELHEPYKKAKTDKQI